MSSDRDPERIAHFRIIQKIGAGGMGVVYRAEDEKLRRTVALKLLPDAFAADEERRRRFLREARSAAALTHANIATVHDVSEDGARVYIVMELVEGETLRDRIGRGRVPAGETIRIARGIARGLARAHAKGIVHRDLKPDNVVIDADGEPKILDFGLAKLRESEASHGKTEMERAETASIVTGEGRTLGTPQYMSPEQARGDSVDGRSDLFSLGVVLYEMLSGRRPFAGGSSAELLAAVLRDSPEPLAKLAPDAPRELVAIVEKCMAKSPGDRFPGAREVLEVLEALVTSGSVKSQVEMTVATKRDPKPRMLVALLMVAVISAALAVLARRRLSARAGAVSVSAASSAPGRRTMLDWPPPKTSSPEAATVYAEALRALHDGSARVFGSKLDRAIALDPHFAAAHLRHGWRGLNLTAQREHIAAAAADIEALDARDRRFLAFEQKRFASDLAPDACLRISHDLADEMRDDAEAQILVAYTLYSTCSVPREILAPAARALELDPSFAGAEFMNALAFEGLGDLDGEVAAAERCLHISPRAASCMRRRAVTYDIKGRCADLERDARQLVVIEPDSPGNYSFLYAALAAQGADVEALREVVAKQEEKPAEQERARGLVPQNAANLAVYAGDFPAAESSLMALQQMEKPTEDEFWHRADAQLIELYEEEGNVVAAGAVASDYLRRARAWARDGGPSPLRAYVLAALRRSHRKSDEDARTLRDAWLAEEKTKRPTDYAKFGWVTYFAMVAHDAREAREALDALPMFSPLPSLADVPERIGDEGAVYALVGDAEHAIPLLRTGTALCGDIMNGLEPPEIHTLMHQMRQRLLLGNMLEQQHDTTGACEQYGAILARWGQAKPKSVTADAARAHSKGLGCH